MVVYSHNIGVSIVPAIMSCQAGHHSTLQGLQVSQLDMNDGHISPLVACVTLSSTLKADIFSQSYCQVLWG